MTDPNLIYKAKFAELTELLGRTPISTDAGWVEMHEEYKKAWGPSEETVRAPRTRETESWNAETVKTQSSGQSMTECGSTRMMEVLPMAATPQTGANANPQDDSAAGPLEQGFSRKPAPQAGGVDEVGHAREEGEALSGPGITGNGARAETAGTRGSRASRVYQAGRGANGGVLAVCEACGREWEREKRRGRPSLLCGECR